MCFNCISPISVQPMKIGHQRLQQFCYRIRSVHGEPQKKKKIPHCSSPIQIIPPAAQFQSEMFNPCDYAQLSEDIIFLLQVGWKPWTHQCKVVPYGRWWKDRSLVVKDKRQITMDSGGPSSEIPGDQDSYTR